MSAEAKRVRVLIVDDSASVRQSLSSIVAETPDLEVMATASDPFVAAQRIQEEVPDVIILDVEMPRMDGITFLRKLMAQRPIPCVLCSTLLEPGSNLLFEALEAGAVEVIQKPRLDTRQFLTESRIRITDAVRAAARASLRKRSHLGGETQKKLTADVMMPPPLPTRSLSRTTEQVVCIGASTGGTESLREVLMSLPPDSPGIVIVQHMPEKFTAAFAKRLDGLCQIDVKEAEDGDPVIARQGADRAGQSPHPLAAQRRALSRRRQGRSARLAPSPVGRRAVSLGRPIRGRQRGRHHYDRDGRRRRKGLAGNEEGGRRDSRPKRGVVHRIRHAEGGDRARRGRPDRPAFADRLRDRQASDSKSVLTASGRGQLSEPWRASPRE